MSANARNLSRTKFDVIESGDLIDSYISRSISLKISWFSHSLLITNAMGTNEMSVESLFYFSLHFSLVVFLVLSVKELIEFDELRSLDLIKGSLSSSSSVFFLDSS